MKLEITRKDFSEILKNGFSVKELAAATGCSVSRINEVKRLPVEGVVYHSADINTNALYDYFEKNANVFPSVSELKTIAEHKEKEKLENIKIEKGIVSKLGTITDIVIMGKQWLIIVKNQNNEIKYYTKSQYLDLVR